MCIYIYICIHTHIIICTYVHIIYIYIYTHDPAQRGSQRPTNHRKHTCSYRVFETCIVSCLSQVICWNVGCWNDCWTRSCATRLWETVRTTCVSNKSIPTCSGCVFESWSCLFVSSDLLKCRFLKSLHNAQYQWPRNGKRKRVTRKAGGKLTESWIAWWI